MVYAPSVRSCNCATPKVETNKLDYLSTLKQAADEINKQNEIKRMEKELWPRKTSPFPPMM